MRSYTVAGEEQSISTSHLTTQPYKRRDDSLLYVFLYSNKVFGEERSSLLLDLASRKMDMVEKEKPRLELEAVLERYPSLKQVLQNMEQVVWLLDLNTDQILFVSPAFEIVWGRSCESFYVDPLTLIKSVHPEDRVKVMSGSPNETRKSLNQKYRILRPDGSLRWISAHIFLIGDKLPDTSYQVCIAQDITAQNQVDETLAEGPGSFSRTVYPQPADEPGPQTGSGAQNTDVRG